MCDIYGPWDVPIIGADPEPLMEHGDDPWLVSRMSTAAEAAEAELAIRELLWAELSGWLVGASRAVLRAIVPDPYAIYSRVPAWTAAVNRVVRGPIRNTIGVAYEALLGAGYRFDSRPAVVEHLATVTNRMVRTADTAFDLVAREVSVGANLGEGAVEIAARVDRVLSVTATERWPNRATVVARTETMGALNAGRSDAFTAVEEELGGKEKFEQMWVATMDKRTRPTHKAADGQRVASGQPFIVGGSSLRFPGDPFGPGKEIIQCRCSLALMEVGETLDLTKRQFKNY